MKAITLLFRTCAVALACAALAPALVSCGESKELYRLDVVASPAPNLSDQSFLLISDTQYAVPFTDYDVRYQLGKQLVNLPPSVTTRWARTFYRHSEAHFSLPFAFEQILNDESKRSFGMFGGDMAEFSCNDETKKIFSLLKAHPQLPFIVAIGNHDATFHGSYDTDAIAEAGQGPWDVYSFDLWGRVCENRGGRLTKTGFIRQLLAYYEAVWATKFHQALSLEETQDYPLGVQLKGVTQAKDWQLEFAFRLGPDDSPESHRQSYFYQRWTLPDPPKHATKLGVTVLDTMDLGSRPVLCDSTSKPVQIGLGGAISRDQIEWLETLQTVSGPHFVLSHHMPFEAIKRAETQQDMDECETTYGARCLGTRLANALQGATYIYGHVHDVFQAESLTEIATVPCVGKGTPADNAQASPRVLPFVRLPSLIDNKSYVVFEHGQFSNVPLPQADKLKCDGANDAGSFCSAAPFAGSCDMCEQRYLEYLELARNIDCFQDSAKCPSVSQLIAQHRSEAQNLCKDSAAALSTQYPAPWKACAAWPVTDRWRCVLGALANDAMGNVDAAKRDLLGTQLLSAVKTLTSKDHVCP
ncbi:MAG TPA: hypothetical protein VGM29_07040 [Polyangiaceae bacterium]|jgi:hypothetical protein